jgi:hypothetical protein
VVSQQGGRGKPTNAGTDDQDRNTLFGQAHRFTVCASDATMQ